MVGSPFCLAPTALSPHKPLRRFFTEFMIPKVDIGYCTCLLLGGKQTCPFAEVRFCGRYWG
jgi:hypothetical protein